MKQIVCIIAFLIGFTKSIAQTTAFTVKRNSGQITQIHQQKSNIVFAIDATKGEISNVYIFKDIKLAAQFMKNGDRRFLPLEEVFLGQHSNVSVFIDSYNAIEYAKNYSNYSRAGIVGAVTKIDNYAFDYHLRIGDNSKIGIVGKLKKVGGHNIAYQKNYSSYVRDGIAGKIANLGTTSFSYYDRNSFSEMANYVGKVSKVGSVDVKFNKPYARTEFKAGKIEAIGNIKFEYYINTYQNESMGVVGKFKSTSGSDNRVKIWFR